MKYYFPEELRLWSANPKNLHGKHFPGLPEKAIPEMLEWIAGDREIPSSMEELTHSSPFPSLSTNSSEIPTGNLSMFQGIPKELSTKTPPHRDIIAIGDVVSEALLTHPNVFDRIKYCFFDDKTQQGTYQSGQIAVNWKKIELINPEGYLTSDVLEFFDKTIQDPHPYLVRVDGEEDLIVIAAVLYSFHAYVVYGQPPIPSLSPPVLPGAVVIKVTQKVKKLYRKIIPLMKEVC